MPMALVNLNGSNQLFEYDLNQMMALQNLNSEAASSNDLAFTVSTQDESVSKKGLTVKAGQKFRVMAKLSNQSAAVNGVQETWQVHVDKNSYCGPQGSIKVTDKNVRPVNLEGYEVKGSWQGELGKGDFAFEVTNTAVKGSNCEISFTKIKPGTIGSWAPPSDKVSVPLHIQ